MNERREERDRRGMGFGNVLWVMFAALMFMAIWIVITVFADLSRRSDIGDVANVLWILLIFVVLFFGALVRFGRSTKEPRHRGFPRDASSYARSHPVRGTS